MGDNSNSDKKWLFLLLFYLLLIYAPYCASQSSAGNDFIIGDCFYYRAVIDSILQDGDLLLANNIGSDILDGQLALGINGLVPKHPILMPLVSLPFYYFFGNTGLLLFNILMCLLLHTLIFKLNRLFFDPLISFSSSILYASATLFLDYSYNYSPDLFSTVLIIGGLYLFLAKRYFIGAFLLGLSVFAKVTNLPLVAVIMFYSVFVTIKSDAPAYTKSKTIVIAAIALILGILPFAYTNYILFDSPFVTGYQRSAVAGPSQNQIVINNHADRFNQPLFSNSIKLLFDKNKGIITTSPVLLLAVIGAVSIKRKDLNSKIFLIFILCLMQFIIIAKFDYWYMSQFSNRFLMTTIALSSIFASIYIRGLFSKFKLHPDS